MIFKKKMPLIAFVFLKLQTAKDAVRQISKMCRFLEDPLIRDMVTVV